METFKTTEEGPKMFDPVVIPLPLALVAAVLVVAAMAYRRYLDSDATWNPVARLSVRPPAPAGRHRLADASEPFRDWAAIAAERMAEAHRREHRRPTLVVIPGGLDTWDEPMAAADGGHRELMVIAGHDDHPVAFDDDTCELMAVR